MKNLEEYKYNIVCDLQSMRKQKKNSRKNRMSWSDQEKKDNWQGNQQEENNNHWRRSEQLSRNSSSYVFKIYNKITKHQIIILHQLTNQQTKQPTHTHNNKFRLDIRKTEGEWEKCETGLREIRRTENSSVWPRSHEKWNIILIILFRIFSTLRRAFLSFSSNSLRNSFQSINNTMLKVSKSFVRSFNQKSFKVIVFFFNWTVSFSFKCEIKVFLTFSTKCPWIFKQRSSIKGSKWLKQC